MEDKSEKGLWKDYLLRIVKMYHVTQFDQFISCYELVLPESRTIDRLIFL